jgi:hypothetical protein
MGLSAKIPRVSALVSAELNGLRERISSSPSRCSCCVTRASFACGTAIDDTGGLDRLPPTISHDLEQARERLLPLLGKSGRKLRDDARERTHSFVVVPCTDVEKRQPTQLQVSAQLRHQRPLAEPLGGLDQDATSHPGSRHQCRACQLEESRQMPTAVDEGHLLEQHAC